MEDLIMKMLAAQLRQPSGEFGKELGTRMNESNHHINLNTINALKLNAGDHLLEIEMGNGHFVSRLFEREKTVEYTGCDFSETMVNAARENNRDLVEAGRVRLICADVVQLPFADDSFHTVFTVNTVYFWSDPVLVLTEMKRVLKPGGEFVVALRPASVMRDYPFVKYGFELYSAESLCNLFFKNGFDAVVSQKKEEPDQGFNGEALPFETLIVRGKKPDLIV